MREWGDRGTPILLVCMFESRLPIMPWSSQNHVCHGGPIPHIAPRLRRQRLDMDDCGTVLVSEP